MPITSIVPLALGRTDSSLLADVFLELLPKGLDVKQQCLSDFWEHL
jgi:hypothetical protein